MAHSTATATHSITQPHVTPERIMQMAWGYAAPGPSPLILATKL